MIVHSHVAAQARSISISTATAASLPLACRLFLSLDNLTAGLPNPAGPPTTPHPPHHHPAPAAGFVIFICLTVATVRLQPAGVALKHDAVAAFRQLQESGSTNLYDLLHTLGTWESRLLQVGVDGNVCGSLSFALLS